ncbi:MAG: hypothetical protein A2007_02200 [Verrucomicrobia bacterium GWC2_42_7]|nr:MAG: hypothetical protein A2007_02200 [Verrucomicrobia bacterium GWC2_42_7]
MKTLITKTQDYIPHEFWGKTGGIFLAKVKSIDWKPLLEKIVSFEKRMKDSSRLRVTNFEKISYAQIIFFSGGKAKEPFLFKNINRKISLFLFYKIFC